MSAVTVVGRCVNAVVMPLVQRFSGWPRNVGDTGMGVLSYEGRRSGRAVRIVVGFRRSESGATITVELADRKQWWRNFTGKGWPATLEVRREPHPGHAVAIREPDGKVHVDIELDAAG